MSIAYVPTDDRRTSINERRDHGRPVEWFRGKTAEIWGCGALGSWFAEVLVRAGVAHLRLRDVALVKGGLLVRQNYTEGDTGLHKAEALAGRLRQISDDVVVEAFPHAGPDDVPTPGDAVDLLVDASVSVVAAAALDHGLTSGLSERLRIVQLATDTDTATLGLVHILRGDGGATISDVDASTRFHVAARSDLEPFSAFWEADDDALFSPTRGCSAPTFRGSAADAMGVATTAASLAGPILGTGLQGSFLFALPHSPAQAPARTWIGFGDPADGDESSSTHRPTPP